MSEVIATLRLPDGRIFDYHSQVDSRYVDGQVGWWTEGNAGCDCNRSIFLNDEYGLALDDSRCGESITLVSLAIDGVKIWPV